MMPIIPCSQLGVNHKPSWSHLGQYVATLLAGRAVHHMAPWKCAAGAGGGSGAVHVMALMLVMVMALMLVMVTVMVTVPEVAGLHITAAGYQPPQPAALGSSAISDGSLGACGSMLTVTAAAGSKLPLRPGHIS